MEAQCSVSFVPAVMMINNCKMSRTMRTERREYFFPGISAERVCIVRAACGSVWQRRGAFAVRAPGKDAEGAAAGAGAPEAGRITSLLQT